jgi:hypothetical protein
MGLVATGEPKPYPHVHPAHGAKSEALSARESLFGLELVGYRAPEASGLADPREAEKLCIRVHAAG